MWTEKLLRLTLTKPQKDAFFVIEVSSILEDTECCTQTSDDRTTLVFVCMRMSTHFWFSFTSFRYH